MDRKFDIWKWLAPLTLLLATACGYEEIVAPDVYVEETVPYVELRIAIPIANPTGTRANPMGGEEGNGRERGIVNEDKINDINIFFYRDPEGMNGDDATKILGQLYYNIKDPSDSHNSELVESATEGNQEEDISLEKPYISLKFKYWEDNVENAVGLKFLAIANVGPIGAIPDLGTLRNLDLKDYSNSWSTTYDAYSKNASNMNYFLMTTAYNDNYNADTGSTGSSTIVKNGIDGQYSGYTTLQRLYARLDLWYSKDDNVVMDASGEKISELKYVAGSTENKVYITNVLPVNIMRTPSFVFKKVTDFGNWTDWTTSGFGTLQNPSYSWGGKENTSEGPYLSSGSSDFPLNYVIERHTFEKTSDGTGSLEMWYGNTRISKVKDDISSSTNGKLLEYYHGKPNSQSDPDYGCDHIAIISYANENTHPTDCFHPNYLTGMAFRAVYVPAEIYGSLDDLSKEPVKIGEDASLTKIYRYSPSKDRVVSESDSKYFASEGTARDYAALHPDDQPVITEFEATPHGDEWGLVCYYNLWLRHYNNENADPQATYPMEYATVRNNIYRVSVSFSGPGDPVPTMREPDTMKARIFVRKWNYREEDTFYFD